MILKVTIWQYKWEKDNIGKQLKRTLEHWLIKEAS